MKSVCVFCGSSSGKNKLYLETASELGQRIAMTRRGTVYGGASIGLMGAVADGALAAGGTVKGVMPHSLIKMEVAHQNLTEFHDVDSMHSRKQLMYDLSDCFVAIPGGMGTMDEFCEIVTWGQLKSHEKPCFILNINGYYDHFIAHVQKMNEEGFFADHHMPLVKVVPDLDSFFAALDSLGI